MATPTADREFRLPNMTSYRLMWFMQYFPCHDHRLPPRDVTYARLRSEDYWSNDQEGYSQMHSNIGLP